MNKEKVLIVYHYIAKYREPVFKELMNSNELQFIYNIASDVKSNNDIQLVESDFYEENFIKLSNIWITKKHLFQLGFITAYLKLRPKKVIFLADPNFVSTWFYAAILKLLRVEVIFWTHGFLSDKGLGNKMKLIYFKLADKIFLYGDRAKDNLISLGLPSSKLFPIYNSLDFDKQQLLLSRITEENRNLMRTRLFNDPNLPVLYFVGRLTHVKKLDVLIKLVNELDKDHTPVNLVLIGTGEAESSLKQLAAELILNRSQVVFYGKTYKEEELCELITACDLCVSPGEIGLSCMHSLGYGVPVATHSNYFTQMPEYEAVIDNYTGVLFEDGNFDSMFNSIKRFIDSPIKDVQKNCLDVIRHKYTPKAQVGFIEYGLSYEKS